MKVFYNHILFIFICVVFSAKGQEPFMYHYLVKDGLPSKQIHCIYEDSKGYIWICTDAGIAKYNANTFKVFDSSNDLPDNTVFEVFEDKKNRLWFRTLSGGIGFIRNDSIYPLKANKRIIELQGKGIIGSFSIDKKGDILLGLTNDEECFFIRVEPPYDISNVIKEKSKYVKKLGIEAVIFGERIVYSEYRPRVSYELSQKNAKFSLFICCNPKGDILVKDSIDLFETGSFTKIHLNGKELLYTTRYLLIKYDLSSGKKQRKYFDYGIVAVMNRGDNYLVGFRKQGVINVSGTGKKDVEINYLKGKTVSVIFSDSHGGQWYGTLEDGVYYCPNLKHFKIGLFENESQQQEITTFKKVSDSIFIIGTNIGNIYRLMIGKDFKVNKELIFSSTDKDMISYLFKISPSTFIVSSGGKAFGTIFKTKLNKTYKVLDSFPSHKHAVLIDDEFISLAVKDLLFYDTLNFHVKKQILFKDRVTGLAFNKAEKTIYAGGLHGLYSLNKDTGTIPLMIMEMRVEDLLSVNNKLFIASKNNGVFIKTNSVIDTITTNQGLLSNVCSKLFYNNGELWVISNKGIDRVMYKGYRNYSIRSYPFSEFAFPESIENICFIENTLMFFDKGEMIFFPFSQKHITQSFRLGNIYVNNKKINAENELSLNYNESELTVNLEALFYSNNSNIQYRYKFKSMDSAWKYIDRAVINFPSVSPGKYELEIQAKDQNNVWIACERNLKFNIDKPFWLKWWFILGEVIIVLSICLVLVVYRYKAVLQKERVKNKLLAEMHELKIKVIKAQINPHFISNCLAAIQELIYSNQIEKAGHYIAKFSFFLREILNSSDKTFIKLKEELEIIKLNIELEKLRFKDDFEFTINVDKELPIDEIQLPSLITQPFIENAIWHGLLPLKGIRKPKLTVSVFSKEKKIYIEIEDNGVGRKPVQSGSVHISKGTKLVLDKIESTNKLYNEHCELDIVDLTDKNGDACGTKIIIKLMDN